MRGVTIWRVNGSSECPLPHRSTSSSICGLGNAFTARSGTGFGTSDVTSYTSTLSGTANPALNGTLVECFGPANNIDPGNRVDGSILQIIGQFIPVTVGRFKKEITLYCFLFVLCSVML